MALKQHLNLLFLLLFIAVCLDILLILLIADFVFAIGPVIYLQDKEWSIK